MCDSKGKSYLHRLGLPLGAQDDKGATALLLTSVQGIHAAITPLIDAKAAVDAQDQANDTALQNYGRLYRAVYQQRAVKPSFEPVNALRAP